MVVVLQEPRDCGSLSWSRCGPHSLTAVLRCLRSRADWPCIKKRTRRLVSDGCAPIEAAPESHLGSLPSPEYKPVAPFCLPGRGRPMHIRGIFAILTLLIAAFVSSAPASAATSILLGPRCG